MHTKLRLSFGRSLPLLRQFNAKRDTTEGQHTGSWSTNSEDVGHRNRPTELKTQQHGTLA